MEETMLKQTFKAAIGFTVLYGALSLPTYAQQQSCEDAFSEIADLIKKEITLGDQNCIKRGGTAPARRKCVKVTVDDVLNLHGDILDKCVYK